MPEVARHARPAAVVGKALSLRYALAHSFVPGMTLETGEA
jgi:hypothetical protein